MLSYDILNLYQKISADIFYFCKASMKIHMIYTYLHFSFRLQYVLSLHDFSLQTS